MTKDDFVFADTSEDIGGSGNFVYNDFPANIFAGYHTIVAKQSGLYNPSYYAYLFKSECWRNHVRSMVNTIVNRQKKHFMKIKRSLVTVVLILLIILSGCTRVKEEEKDNHLTVFLWQSRLIKYLVPYIHEQFPDKDIEFIAGNNDTDLYSYYNEHGELPDIITVRRYSGTDAIDLKDELLDLSSYDIVSEYYNYALQYYYNSDNSINWLPVCGIPQTIIANKTLFDRYDIKIPTNYEEYAEACDKFYELGIKPYSMDLGEDWSNHEIVQAGAIDFFTSIKGIKWRNEAESASGLISFNDESWTKVFEQVNQFIKDSHFTVDDLNVNEDDGWTTFVNKESAMYHGTPEILKYSETDMGGDELIRLPYFSQDDGEGYIYTVPSLHVALNKNKVLICT